MPRNDKTLGIHREKSAREKSKPGKIRARTSSRRRERAWAVFRAFRINGYSCLLLCLAASWLFENLFHYKTLSLLLAPRRVYNN